MALTSSSGGYNPRNAWERARALLPAILTRRHQHPVCGAAPFESQNVEVPIYVADHIWAVDEIIALLD
jgi:hypothetical protein